MPDCRKKNNWVPKGWLSTALVLLGIVAVVLAIFLFISNESSSVSLGAISSEEASSIEETREIFNLLADGKYTEVFSQIKSSDEMVLSYLRAVLYDKGYGTTMNVNAHIGKTWVDLEEIGVLRGKDKEKIRVLDKKYAALNDLIRKEAEAGNPVFQILMAYLTRLGIGCPIDEFEAANWYRLAVNENNDPLAMCELGQMLRSSLSSIGKNREEALELFKRASEQGYAEGEIWFAEAAYTEKIANLNGLAIYGSTSKDTTKKYIKQALKAAEKGHIPSIVSLASKRLFGGRYVEVDLQKSYMWTYLEWLNRQELDVPQKKYIFPVDLGKKRERGLRSIQELMESRGMDAGQCMKDAIEEATRRYAEQAKYLYQRK